MIEILVARVNEDAVRDAIADLGLEIEEQSLRDTDWTPDTRRIRVRTSSARDGIRIVGAGAISWSFAEARD